MGLINPRNSYSSQHSFVLSTQNSWSPSLEKLFRILPLLTAMSGPIVHSAQRLRLPIIVIVVSYIPSTDSRRISPYLETKLISYLCTHS
ncbi:hypothetical protein J6590_038576 [Homalodisca vitripennis]|nr:hypothetical protein J6590_038576 [Homalodisca vitripennis]